MSRKWRARLTSARRAQYKRCMRIVTGLLSAGLLTTILASPPRVEAQGSNGAALASDPACQTLTPAAAGGTLPRGRSVVVLRWLGIANYELSYRGTVLLLDAAYSRTAPATPVGFGPADAKRANAIFIGHGHGDHVWDVIEVAKKTGAPVYGGPQVVAYLKAQGIPEAQIKPAATAGIVKFDGFTVEPIQYRHSPGRPPAVQKAMAAYEQAYKEIIRPHTPEEEKEWDAIGERRGPGQGIDETGTYAYLFTFDNGFRLLYTDTAGPPSDALKQAIAKTGSLDVTMVGYQGRFLAARQNDESLPIVRLTKPRYVIPTHHDDEAGGARPDMPIFPLAMAIREELPNTRTISPLYRSPICFDTATKEYFLGL
jgi:L-ascorbate metabolism protein UlaG (beta-lactamase superfamily)